MCHSFLSQLSTGVIHLGLEHICNVNIPTDMSTYYAVSCLGFQNNQAKGLNPLHGPDESFNLSPILLQAILKSEYFAMFNMLQRDTRLE